MLEENFQLLWAREFQFEILILFELHGMLVPKVLSDILATKGSFVMFIIRRFSFPRSFGAGITFKAPAFVEAKDRGVKNAVVSVTEDDKQAELSLVLVMERARTLVRGRHCATRQYPNSNVTIR